ncbi:MAG TPA: 16S rRNA (cytosine(1402)-N(4))-methyltransferase RsmH [Kiritimatiellia bacterium]|nr:16S rRNA (cytosine(1402)-N(4))-methyltransferase RsmH [Kiritimatiellia bacterium]HMP32863.1 16S rRNA (cytosine(1402)-N(4))-methyltransferase RsmH [Kiritimatiellia bacterium]
MKDETMALLAVKAGGRYIDGTLGLGGHSEAMLDGSSPDGRVVGVDRDPDALRRAGERLRGYEGRFTAVHGNYADLPMLVDVALDPVDGILLDLGVSSMQLDDAARGFSFLRDGPLDMRMDPGQGISAADLVNGLSERALADTIYQYGEEPASRRIAAAIVRARSLEPITTTARLAAIVGAAVGGRHGKTHPATRTFQALRMAVNEEIEGLRRGLDGALSLLRKGGRLAVISFHSLEDREVKQCFREHAAREESLPQGGVRQAGRSPLVTWVNKKAVTAGEVEIRANPRARSAKLRVVERIE